MENQRESRGVYPLFRMGIWLGVSLLLLVQCTPPTRAPYQKAQGTAIGTFYSVTYQDSAGRDLRESFDSLYEAFNHQFSLFDSGSTLSRFNRSKRGIVDSSLAKLTRLSQQWALLSQGAFDPTAGPLVEIWGFADKGISHRPSDSLVAQTLKHVGMRNVVVQGDTVLKLDSLLRLNFNAVAKGLLVDRTGEMLQRLGVKNYLVEIGGEIKTEGLNPNGQPWRVGIEAPDSTQLPGNDIVKAINLTQGGMATSGNYRQARTLDGARWSHIVDPRTGFPANTDVLSATVIAPTTTQADALATAMIVLGIEGAQKLTAQLDSVRTILIYAKGEGEYGFWDSNDEK